MVSDMEAGMRLCGVAEVSWLLCVWARQKSRGQSRRAGVFQCALRLAASRPGFSANIYSSRRINAKSLESGA